jgi:DNA-binding MarR family transcriptional regulator
VSDELQNYAARFHAAMEQLWRKMNQDLSVLGKLGVTPPQLYMMFVLCEKGQCKVTSLAEHVGVKPSAITVMIDRLIQQGLAQRQHDEQDRRVVMLAITDKGKQVLRKFEQTRNEIMRSYFVKLEPGEVEQMVRILEKLAGDPANDPADGFASEPESRSPRP